MVTKLVWIEVRAPFACSPMKISPSSMFMRLIPSRPRTLLVGAEPLGVLLVAVEEEHPADEALVEKRPRVLNAGAVAEREPELGLETFLPGELRGPSRLPVIVGDGLFPEKVLSRLERGNRELEMGVGGRGHGDA